MYNVGTRVAIIDEIDGSITNGTIKFIEHDSELNIGFFYIVADDEVLNDKNDPRFNFQYWDIIDSDSEYISRL